MKNERHIMLDIETLGNGSNALILSIGAVEFFPYNPKGMQLGRSFEVLIDPEDAAKYGAIDASTVMWWMRQDDAARRVLTNVNAQRLTLPGALDSLRRFIQLDDDLDGVWGNGATFDNVILQNAARACGQPPLWGFRLDRDMRTLRWLEASLGLQTSDPISGVSHSAIDDALWQAEKVCLILSAIDRKPGQ